MIYFYNLVNREKSQMMFSFIMSQFSNPIKGDWILQVINDFNDLNINYGISYLQKISETTFKTMVKRNIRKFLFAKLISQKNAHSKMKDLDYTELKMKPYLLQTDLTYSETITSI